MSAIFNIIYNNFIITYTGLRSRTDDAEGPVEGRGGGQMEGPDGGLGAGAGLYLFVLYKIFHTIIFLW